MLTVLIGQIYAGKDQLQQSIRQSRISPASVTYIYLTCPGYPVARWSPVRDLSDVNRDQPSLHFLDYDDRFLGQGCS